MRPTKTLFVINFDPINTRMRDLERHFEPYGKISNVRIRRNFAFIHFELQEDATKALEATNMRCFLSFPSSAFWCSMNCQQYTKSFPAIRLAVSANQLYHDGHDFVVCPAVFFS